MYKFIGYNVSEERKTLNVFSVLLPFSLSLQEAVMIISKFIYLTLFMTASSEYLHKKGKMRFYANCGNYSFGILRSRYNQDCGRICEEIFKEEGFVKKSIKKATESFPTQVANLISI